MCGKTGGSTTVEERVVDNCLGVDTVLGADFVEEVSGNAKVSVELDRCELLDTIDLKVGRLDALGDGGTIVDSVVQLVESDGTSEPCAATPAAMLAIARNAGFIAVMKVL